MGKLQRKANGKILRRRSKLRTFNDASASTDCCCPETYGFCINCPAPGCRGQYSNDSTTAGTDLFGPIATGPFVFDNRPEAPIDFTYPADLPTGVNAAFQVQWDGFIYAPVTGNYTFYIAVTNGACSLAVDGTTRINQWTTPTTGDFSTATIALTAGDYKTIRVCYRNQSGAAGSIRLDWSYPSQSRQTIPANMLAYTATGVTTGIEGKYFNDIALTAPAVLTRTDANINFTWAGSPGGSVNADNFSVRWEGKLWISTAGKPSIVFSTDTKDGVRLWVNNQQIINDWTDHGGSTTTNTATAVELRQGFYDIKMEVYSKTGTALAQLYWAINGASRVIVPQSSLFKSGDLEERPSELTVTFSGVTMDATGTCVTSGSSGIKYVSGELDGVTLCLRQVSACRYEYDSKYDGDPPIIFHYHATGGCAAAVLDPICRFAAAVVYGSPVDEKISVNAGVSVADGSVNADVFDNTITRAYGLCSATETISNANTPLTSNAFGQGGTATVSDGCVE